MIFWGRLKNTGQIEQERKKLWDDYQTYLKVEQSEALRSYLTLKEKVESKPFQEKKKEIEGLKYKGSSEEKLLKQYKKLSNKKSIVKYFDVKNSTELVRFKQIQESGQLERLDELEKFVKGGSFKAEKSNHKKQVKAGDENIGAWEETEAFKKKAEYEQLKSSDDILFYKKFKKSRAYKNFLKVDNSSLLSQFEDLKAEIESEPFAERKAYLEDEKRYEKTDDYKIQTQFEELDKDPEIQLYMDYNDTDKFKFFREWNLTFEETFKSFKDNNWTFTTPVAEKGPGRNFSIGEQLHYANDKDNFDLENGVMTLETKKEQVEGLYWDSQFGFMPKTFNFASGLVHSLKSFMQEYGHYEVKIKVSKIKGVVSSFSLVDEDEDTCIKLFSANGNVVKGGIVNTNQLKKNFIGISLKTPPKGYVIIGLNWTPEKLEWTVNEKLMGVVHENIPHAPLGMRIETEVFKATDNLPHRLDIDWIRCYQKN